MVKLHSNNSLQVLRYRKFFSGGEIFDATKIIWIILYSKKEKEDFKNSLTINSDT